MSNLTIQIREAAISDIPVIGQLAWRIWPAVYSQMLPAEQVRFMLDKFYRPEVLEEQMTVQQQRFLMLEVNGQPQGFASYTIGPRPATAKLNKLYLDPALHGRGLGKQLVKAVEERLQQAGCRVLYLNVNRHNPARFVYERLGFRIVGKEDIPVGPFRMNDFIMRKELR